MVEDAVALIWPVIRGIGSVGGALSLILLAVYFYPGSPLRHWVERWIDRRVGHRFDRELEQYRHQLALDAERIRAEHQRLLHNAAIVAERKHQVFRKLFRLTHIANGAVAHLFGVREEPTFEDHTVEDIRNFLDGLNVAAGVKDPIVAGWNDNRADAVAELKRVKRRVEIHEAEGRYAEAWNYYLTNSLYLPEPISQKAASVFEALREILAIAKFPDGARRRDSGEHKRAASDRMEELRILLRRELAVVTEADG